MTRKRTGLGITPAPPNNRSARRVGQLGFRGVPYYYPREFPQGAQICSARKGTQGSQGRGSQSPVFVLCVLFCGNSAAVGRSVTVRVLCRRDKLLRARDMGKM